MSNITALTDQQNKIYVSVLELGTDTVAHISKKAGFPRSTCYLIIDELIELGLVSQIKKGGKTLIIAEPPTKLVDLLKNKRQDIDASLDELEKDLPKLHAIHNTRTDKPLVRFYEGLEGIKNIMQDTLDAKEILVFCSGYDTPLEKHLSTYLDSYFEKVNERSIQTLEILGEAPDLEPYIKKYQSKTHQLKTIKYNKAVKHIDKMIFGNKVAIVSFENLNGVVVENSEIAEFERELFYKLWNSVSEIKRK